MDRTITKIEVQKRNKDRVNVYINDEFAFACSSELVYCHNLQKGRVIDLDGLKEVIIEDNYIKCKSVALKYIERTLKTKNQIIEYLIKKEFEEITVSRVIEFLEQYNFIDDKNYVKAFLNTNIKKWSKNKIFYDLKHKGIDEETINTILNEVTYEDEKKCLIKLAEKKAKILCGKESDKRKIIEKLTLYLQSRGCDFETIKDIVKELDITPKEMTESDHIRKSGEFIKLATNRYESLKRTEQDKIKLKRKLQDYLLRKGYSYEEINSYIRAIEE